MTNKSTVLITGTSGYIGKNLKEFFTSKGFDVVAPDRTDCNLSVIGSMTNYLSTLAKTGIAVDFIINNAASQVVEEFKAMTPESIADIFQINCNAIAESYAFVSKNNLQVKSILNISSIEAIHPRGGHANYGASKAALESLTRSAAVELAPTRSNALRLGLISRPGIESSWPEGVNSWKKQTPLSRLGEIKDVTQAAKFLLLSEWITGEILTLDGGNSATPNW